MSNSLAKTAAAHGKPGKAGSLGSALKNGGPIVWLSCLIMGLGNIMAGQVVKGLLFLAIEVAVIVFLCLPEGGLHWISMLPGLGDKPMQEVWNENEGIYEYIMGDQSNLILLYGVASICIIVALILFWQSSVRSGYQALCLKRNGQHVPTIVEDVKSLFDENVHKLLMTPPFLCLLVFTIIPLLYMMCMAFTNYSKVNDHLVLFDWVGIDNFISIFDANSAVGKQFWDVLVWTLIWAFFATFLNFFMGTFVAMVINRNSIKLKGLWRGVLSLTIAVPQFVSLMIIRSMFLERGIVNQMLQNWGILDASINETLPFLSNATWARVLVIIVNLWVGIPYTIMQVTGILKNIPAEQYEAARIDGANAFQQFRKITLPYMIFVMTPYLITQFTGNINKYVCFFSRLINSTIQCFCYF